MLKRTEKRAIRSISKEATLHMAHLNALKRLIGSTLPIVFLSSLSPGYTQEQQWTIKKSTDKFSDRTSCYAVQNVEGSKPQISKDGSIYISMRGYGGLSMYRFRYNDSSPHSWRLPSDIEERSGAIKIPLNKWKNDSRLRVRVYTLTQNIADFDIDVPSAIQALNQVKNCHMVPLVSPHATSPQAPGQ